MATNKPLAGKRLPSLFGAVVFLASAFLFGLAIAWSDNVVEMFGGRIKLSGDMVFLGGVLLVIVGFVVKRLPAPLGLFIATLVVGLLVVLVSGANATKTIQVTRTNVDLVKPVRIEAKIYDNHWLSIVTEEHARYGPVAVSNMEATERVVPDFNVTYAIGNDHWRTIPDARPEVTILGCSTTFGVGVKDDESYPAVLNNKYWTNHKVRNCSLMGYGTRQAYLILEDRLQVEPLPVAVFYGWLRDHIRRNYLGTSYHGGFSPESKFPFFELVGDTVEFRGLRECREATMPSDDPETYKKEVAVTIALVRQMNEMCQQKKVPFYFVMLGQKYTIIDDPVANYVKESGIPFLELRSMNQGFFENDPHPNQIWHAATAKAIADDPRLEFLKPSSPSK